MALTDSLISYWAFDESSGNATDSHGPNDLTNNNSTAYATGKINNGADFEKGSSNYFSIADGAQTGLDLATDFTFNVWLKFETLPSGTTQCIFDKRVGGNGYSMYYYDAAGTRKWSSNIQATSVDLTDTGISAGTFYMTTFVYTKSAGTIDIYRNASSVGQMTSLSTALAASTDSFMLGEDSAGDRHFDGIMDEMGVWSRALSGSEITELYAAGAGNAYPFSTVQNLTLTADTVSFALTGISIGLGRAYTLLAGLGSFILTGVNVVLSRTGTSWTNLSKNVSSFTNKTKNTSTWDNKTKN